MPRPAFAVLLMLMLAACTTAGAPSPSATEAPVATPGSTEAPLTPEPSSSPEPPTWTGHAAAGLAMVRTADPATGLTHVFVVDADGELRQVTGVSGATGASFPVWSPDGSQLAFGAPKIGFPGINGFVGVVNADGSEERQLGEGASIRWSPDGTRISFTEVDDVTSDPIHHFVVDVASGEVSDLGEGANARWLDDDRMVFHVNELGADGSVRPTAHALTLSTGASEVLAENTTVTPSPDGSMLLLLSEGVVSIAPTDDLSAAREIASGTDAVWSADGTRIAVYYDYDEQVRGIWAVVDLEGRTIQSGIVGDRPTWSPDGTRLGLEYFNPEGEASVQVVDVASGEVVFELEGQQPAWRP